MEDKSANFMFEFKIKTEVQVNLEEGETKEQYLSALRIGNDPVSSNIRKLALTDAYNKAAESGNFDCEIIAARDTSRIEAERVFLQLLMDGLNKVWKAETGHPTIFTEVYYWISVDLKIDGHWMAKTTDGLGDYAIARTFDEANMWFIQRARSLGYESAERRAKGGK